MKNYKGFQKGKVLLKKLENSNHCKSGKEVFNFLFYVLKSNKQKGVF